MRPEQVREVSLLLLIVGAILIFGSLIDGYYTDRTFNRIASSVAIITVVAVGQTLVVLTRSIDLSVGSIVGCTAFVVGMEIAYHPNMHPIVAVAIAVAMGAAMGAVNGVLVAWGRVPPIIVTLGTLAIYRGILVETFGGMVITTDKLPGWLIDLPRLTLFNIGGLDIRAMVLLAVVVVIAFHLATTYLNFGRQFYALGSNPDAAELIGLPKERIIFTAFLLSGALSGLAGFMFLGRFGNITVQAGNGLELQSVAAVVVGAVNIFGGSGTVIGAMLGGVIIGTLDQSLLRLQISEFWRDAVLGLLILLAVTSDAIILSRLRKLWVRTELKMIAKPPPLPAQPEAVTQ
jgi:rhamnose transport system permease protein